jgi:hypothetical protein
MATPLLALKILVGCFLFHQKKRTRTDIGRLLAEAWRKLDRNKDCMTDN